MSNKQAILLGDSIRIGYQPVVESELADTFTLWAPDTNGGETRRTLEHLDTWVFQHVNGAEDRTVLHMNCGLHDLKFMDENDQPSNAPKIPLEEYKQNVQKLLEAVLQKLPADHVIWALTTPVIDARHAAQKSFIRRQADVENYNRVAAAICKQFDVRIHDLHALVMENDPETIITPDGVHYTDEGKEIQGKAVAAVIRDAAG